MMTRGGSRGIQNRTDGIYEANPDKRMQPSELKRSTSISDLSREKGCFDEIHTFLVRPWESYLGHFLFLNNTYIADLTIRTK